MFDAPALVLLLWLSPLLAAIGFDLLVRRRPHPAYLISAAVLTLAFVRVFLMESDTWLAIGRTLLGPLV
jgi:hypothetical protein